MILVIQPSRPSFPSRRCGSSLKYGAGARIMTRRSGEMLATDGHRLALLVHQNGRRTPPP
jgi:hypothetical protein